MISQILDGYLADAERREVAAPDRLKFAAAAIKRHVGNLQPHMLTRRAYWDKRAEEGVSDGTIGREVTTLRAALQWSLDETPPWIARAPYVESPSRPPPRDRWLSKAEVRRLVDSAATPHIRLFIMLAYHTAARSGAILDLTWDRVFLDDRRIVYDRPGRRATNKRRATVPINSALLAALQAAHKVAIGNAKKRGEDEPRPFVIEYKSRAVSSIKKGFAAACERAEIDDCSPHVLRHTAATHMVMARVKLAEVARMLGDTEAMVEKVYGKHSPDYLRDAADALAGDFGPRLVSEREAEE